jgi:hypothetical protein
MSSARKATCQALLNHLAFEAGRWRGPLVPLAEMAKRFSLSDVGTRASSRGKLAWVNGTT